MEPDNSPRKIQFTVPLLEPHLDPEAAEQKGKESVEFNNNQTLQTARQKHQKIRRRRPTPATLVLTSDQSSPEIDEDRIPNPLLKSTLSMSPRQRKKMTRTTPTMKELQTMVEHHLGQQKQGEEPEGATESSGARSPAHLGSQTQAQCHSWAPLGQHKSVQNPPLRLKSGALWSPAQRTPQPISHHRIPRSQLGLRGVGTLASPLQSGNRWTLDVSYFFTLGG